MEAETERLAAVIAAGVLIGSVVSAAYYAVTGRLFGERVLHRLLTRCHIRD